MTQEQSNQNECQILIYSVQDFLARHSLSPESEKDLPMQEELSFLKLPGFLKLKDPNVIKLRWPIKILASEMMLGSFYFVINA